MVLLSAKWSGKRHKNSGQDRFCACGAVNCLPEMHRCRTHRTHLAPLCPPPTSTPNVSPFPSFSISPADQGCWSDCLTAQRQIKAEAARPFWKGVGGGWVEKGADEDHDGTPGSRSRLSAVEIPSPTLPPNHKAVGGP